MLETKIGRRDALKGVAIGAWAVGLAVLALVESAAPLPSLSSPAIVVQATPPVPVSPGVAKLMPVAYRPQVAQSRPAAAVPQNTRPMGCLAVLKLQDSTKPSNS